jgi:hypothetical protein
VLSRRGFHKHTHLTIQELTVKPRRIKELQIILAIKIGDTIKLVLPDGSSIEKEISGINFRYPYDILIDSIEDIPIGTEVWFIKNESK